MPEQKEIMLHGGNVWQEGGPATWLDFSANLRPEGMPQWVKDTLVSSIEDARYYPDTAQREAIEGLAAYLGVPVSCVLPFAGGIAAIDMVCRTAQGRVMVDPVTFGEYARRAAAYGRPVAVRTETSDMLPRDTVFLCNPNNPTGSACGRDAIMALHDRLNASHARLCVDEAFIDFCPELTVRQEAARLEGLIVVGSLTKILCVPGVRLGYLVAAPAAIRALRPLCAPWGVNSFAVAVCRALPAHQRDIREDALRTAARRARLTEGLTALGAKVAPSRANFILADFGRPMERPVAQLNRKSILVRTCASFGLPDSYIRFAVKTEAQNERLLSALREALCAENA